MRYVLKFYMINYAAQVEKRAKQNREESKLTCHAEYLSGLKKTDELINRALNATDRAVSSENWREAETVAAEDVPFLYIAYPQNHYFIRDGLRIPEQDKLFPRGQGVSVVENMNEWTWAE